MSELDGLFLDKELEKILQKVPVLIEFQKFYEEIKYLSNLKDKESHEDFFYEIYQPTLKVAATSKRLFLKFTDENYDTF